MPPGGARAPRPVPGGGPGARLGAGRFRIPEPPGEDPFHIPPFFPLHAHEGVSAAPSPPSSSHRLCLCVRCARCLPPGSLPVPSIPVPTCPLALEGSVAAAWPAGGAPPSALAALEPWLPMVRRPPRRGGSARRREAVGAAPRRGADKERGRGGTEPRPPPGRGDRAAATAPSGPGGFCPSPPPPTAGEPPLGMGR